MTRTLICLAIIGLVAAFGTLAAAPVRPEVVVSTATPNPTAVIPQVTPSPVSPTAGAPTPTETRQVPTVEPSPTPIVLLATLAPVTPMEDVSAPAPTDQEMVRAPRRPLRPMDDMATTPGAEPTRATHTTPRPPHRIPVPAAIPGVNVMADVQFAERTGCDPRQATLDIYLPATGRALPVLIYVHGGGWTGGDKNPVGAKVAYFAGRGFIFVSINYRLIPAAGLTGQATDVAEAIAWIKENIATYGGDGARLFLLGHSAGAHLAALVATDETYLQGVGLELAAIRGVILLDSAAYDVEQLMRSPEGQSETFRPIFETDPAGWRPVSPRAHVAPGKGIPPHLILLATAQGQRRPAAEGLAAALRGAGVYAQIADATAFSDHGSINENLGHPGDTPTAAVQAFLDMLLRGASAGLGGVEVLRP